MSPKDDHDKTNCVCCSRRSLLLGAGAAALSYGMGGFTMFSAGAEQVEGAGAIKPCGPASTYVPTMKAAFVRREGPYGMWWPGAVYDGEAALKKYTKTIRDTAAKLGMRVDVTPKPIYSLEEGEKWVKGSETAKPDGLMVILLDRQQHSWPTARAAAASAIPTVVFSPVGSSFTTNTSSIAHQEGLFISSANTFDEAAYGMKMIAAAARLRETRFIILKGGERRDTQVEGTGTKLRYVPAKMYLDVYRNTETSRQIEAMADDYVKHAERIATGATRQDVINGIKGYVVAQKILEQEQGDGISMDCLGAVGPTDISLPCIAWSRMLDDGIPAACEADIGACLTHALVQYLFDRPGFQQDPVADTVNECVIGAHCTCPTRLEGFDKPAEPYHLSHHHGMRDATPVTHWRPGRRVTVADIYFSKDPKKPPAMIISAGEAVDNVAVPPAGGCVVSVRVKLDGVTDVLAYPGFHQIFFYGDYKKELTSYCQLHGIEAQVV